MRRVCLFLWMMVLVCAAARSAVPEVTPVTKLEDAEPNTWVHISGAETGIRQDAALFWSEALGKFVLAQGITGDRKRKIPCPYDVEVFDRTMVWQNYFPPGKLGIWGKLTGAVTVPGYKQSVNYFQLKDIEGNLRPTARLGCPDGFAVDPDGGGFYLYARGYRKLIGVKPGAIWRYDVRLRVWKEVSPAHDIELASHDGPPKIVGARLVYEPVNQELLLLGGQAPNVAGGSVGNWAYSFKTGTWHRLTHRNARLDALREQALKIKRMVEEAVARARTIYFRAPSATDASQVKTILAPRVNSALDALRSLEGRLKLAGGDSRERLLPEFERARSFVSSAGASLRLAGDGFARGELKPALIKAADDAHWALDRAADCLASEPPARAMAAAAYDPNHRVVVLFGGDHLDYVMADTWIYYPDKRIWRQVFPKTAPPARREASLMALPTSGRLALVGGKTVSCNPNFTSLYYRLTDSLPADVWTFDVATMRWERLATPSGEASPTFTTTVAAGPGDVLVGIATAETWAMRLDVTKPARGPVDEKWQGVGAGDRTYRSVVGRHDPNWYQLASRDTTEEVKAWLDKLPVNQWASVPRTRYEAGGREWGRAIYDPDRDQIYYWTGGHCSDKGNHVATYHPDTNRWSIAYLSETAVSKGQTFNGRPDCLNHTYHNYAYDPVSKEVVAATYGGTGVYNPDTGRWSMTLEKPFKTNHYTMNLYTTPKGVLAWADGAPGGGLFVGLFDVPSMSWKRCKVSGLPAGYRMGPDSDGAVWDSKRGCLWLWGGKGYGSTADQMYRYDLDTGHLEAMNPKNRDTIAKRAHFMREGIYVSELDLVLLLEYTERAEGGRMIAYDPAGNRWVHLGVHYQKDAGSPRAMVYDTRRNLLWCMSGYRRVFVVKLDARALDISEVPPAP